MATEEIGGVHVSIAGDYSKLQASFDTAMALAAQFAGRIATNLNSALPAMDSLGNQFIRTGAAMTAGITAPIVALGAAMASGIDDFRKFELGMRQVTSLMGKVSQSEFKALSNATLELSTRMGVDAVKSARALYEAISAGVPKENALTFLEIATKTAIAGVTETKVAVDGLTTVLNAFHLESTATTKVADAMFMAVNLGKFTFDELARSMHIAIPLAAQVGVTFQEVLAAAATLTKQGVPVSGAMTQIQRAITSLVAPSKEMTALFEKMGVESGKSLLQSKGLAGALQAVRDASGDVESTMFKALRRMEGFRALLGLTGENAASAAEDLQKVTNSTGAMDLAFREIEKSGARGFDSLKVAMKNLSIQAAEVLAPAIAQIVTNIRPMIEGLISAVKWFSSLSPATQQAAIGLTAALAAVGPLTTAVGAFLKIGSAVIPVVGTLTKAIGVGGLVSAAGAAGPALVAIGVAVAGWALFEGVTQLRAINAQLDEVDARYEQFLKNSFDTSRNFGNQWDDVNEKLRVARLHGESFATTAKNLSGTLQATSKDVLGLGFSVKILSDTPPPVKIPVAIKDIGTSAKESTNAIDDFMKAWNRLHDVAIPTAADLDTAMRQIAKDAYEMADAIGQLPPLLDEAAGAAAGMAAAAEYTGKAMDGIVPPELPDDLDEVAERAKGMGDMIVTQSDRSKEATREIRRAVEGISDALASSIIHWKGFGSAALNVLEAIGEAILKTVIKRLLDASGLIDKLMDGIGAVLAKIGIGGVSGAAGSAASTAAGGVGSSASGAAGTAGSSITGIIGAASAAVGAASGVVSNFQFAHMNTALGRIEESTRRSEIHAYETLKTQLTYLPKLDHLTDIWAAINKTNAILSSGSFGGSTSGSGNSDLLALLGSLLGGGFTGTAGGPGARTIPELAAGMTANSLGVTRRGPNVLGGGSTSGPGLGFTGAGFPGLGGTTEYAFAPGYDLDTGGGAGFEEWLARQNFTGHEGIIAKLRASGVTDTQLFQWLARFSKGSDLSGAEIGMGNWLRGADGEMRYPSNGGHSPSGPIGPGVASPSLMESPMTTRMGGDAAAFGQQLQNMAATRQQQDEAARVTGQRLAQNTFSGTYGDWTRDWDVVMRSLTGGPAAFGAANDGSMFLDDQGNIYGTRKNDPSHSATFRRLGNYLQLYSQYASGAGIQTRSAAPIDYAASMANYSSNLNTSWGPAAPVQGSFGTPWNPQVGNSRGGVSINVNAFDPAPRAMGHAIVEELQNNGIYR